MQHSCMRVTKHCPKGVSRLQSLNNNDPSQRMRRNAEREAFTALTSVYILVTCTHLSRPHSKWHLACSTRLCSPRVASAIHVSHARNVQRIQAIGTVLSGAMNQILIMMWHERMPSTTSISGTRCEPWNHVAQSGSSYFNARFL